ncbi:DUF6527 family protein [uncultured Roseibium sp.]|uniref:DUF6527 family protein n=1 Tax=uncultured Roseibium sp. TaxID=1936171 RepID=UPI0026323619|nr:DUF6527 family protein [uncultured Roseibium sp.]
MTGVFELEHQFVKSVPRSMEAGVLYVSLEYATMLHLCACGCGREVVTPLSPKDWKLTFDGVSISVHPSIGNWAFPCRSHYIIDHGKIRWAGNWSNEQIQRNRERDLISKRGSAAVNRLSTHRDQPAEKGEGSTTLSRFAGWIKSWFN